MKVTIGDLALAQAFSWLCPVRLQAEACLLRIGFRVSGLGF